MPLTLATQRGIIMGKPFCESARLICPLRKQSLVGILFFFITIPLFANTSWKDILRSGTDAQKMAELSRIISRSESVKLPEVISLLDDRSSEIRSKGAEALFLLGDSSFSLSYIKALRDPCWQVRLYGVRALAKWGEGPGILDSFHTALDDTYWQVRYWAADGIAKHGDENSLQPLLSHLKDSEPKVCVQLLRALAFVLGKDPAKATFKSLQPRAFLSVKDLVKNPDIDVAVHSVWFLESSSDSRVVPFLLDYLEYPSDEVKIQAVWALEALQGREGLEELRAKLVEPSVRLRIETIKSMVRMKDSAGVEALVLKLSDKEENVRIYSLWGLERLNDEASYPAIVRALSDSSERVQMYAYNTIRKLNNPDFLPLLINTVEKSEVPLSTRIRAIELLGALKGTDSAIFFASLRGHPEPQIRRAILPAWYKVNPGDADFLSYLDFSHRLDTSSLVRTEAGRIVRVVVADLQKTLGSQVPGERNTALSAISILQKNSLLQPVVRRMIRSSYPEIRKAGVETLPFQPPSSSRAIINEVFSDSDPEILYLGLLGIGKAKLTFAKPYAIRYLKDSNPKLKLAAAYALARLRDSSGAGIATSNLLHNPDVQAQALAVETVGYLSYRNASPYLLRLLEDSELDVKVKTAWALARMNEEKGMYTLVSLSRQDIEPIRTTARNYLIDTAIPLSLRRKIPLIASELEVLRVGVREVALKQIVAENMRVKPVIDGNPGDSAWRALEETSTFFPLEGEKVPAKTQTKIAMGYDAENLYCLIICEDSSASKLTYDSQDFFTLSLNPDKSKNRWYQYTLHPTNFLKFSYVWKNYFVQEKDDDIQWESSWVTATSIQSHRWVGEIAIPLKELGESDPSGKTWEINFQRVSDHLPATTWTGRIDNPSQFGHIFFKGAR